MQINNVGPISDATILLKPLTILIGAQPAVKTTVMYALAALVDWLAASPLKSDYAKQAADQVSALPASYLQPFFGSEVQGRVNSQILATAADFQGFLGEHSTPPEWVYLPRERLGIDLSGTGRAVNGPIGNYQTFVKQTWVPEQGNWPSILRSFSQLQAKETRTVYGFERFLRTRGLGPGCFTKNRNWLCIRSIKLAWLNCNTNYFSRGSGRLWPPTVTII